MEEWYFLMKFFKMWYIHSVEYYLATAAIVAQGDQLGALWPPKGVG